MGKRRFYKITAKIEMLAVCLKLNKSNLVKRLQNLFKEQWDGESCGTALHLACKGKNVELVRFVLNHGGDVATKDKVNTFTTTDSFRMGRHVLKLLLLNAKLYFEHTSN